MGLKDIAFAMRRYGDAMYTNKKHGLEEDRVYNEQLNKDYADGKITVDEWVKRYCDRDDKYFDDGKYWLSKKHGGSSELDDDMDAFVKHVEFKHHEYDPHGSYEPGRWERLWDEFINSPTMKNLSEGKVHFEGTPIRGFRKYYEEEFGKPGTPAHEATESLAEKIDEADGEKDGKFSVHNMDSDDGNHDDQIDVSRLADAIQYGPGHIPNYDEDGNKIDEES